MTPDPYRWADRVPIYHPTPELLEWAKMACPNHGISFDQPGYWVSISVEDKQAVTLFKLTFA